MPDTLTLSEIQKLQFSDKHRAEQAALSMIKPYHGSSVKYVELTPKPESLNSINGFVTFENGERYFFKAHTEENEHVSQYYNSSILAEAGYPVISARQVAHEPGEQIVLYEILTFPTLFDQVEEQEDLLRTSGEEGTANGAQTQGTKWQRLVKAQTELDTKVCKIYQETLTSRSEKEQAAAAIHQLFHHRLQEDGRLGLFYRGNHLELPQGKFSFEQLSQLGWTINGAQYDQSLAQIIERSQHLLQPGAGPAIVGHGDAHNGNVFVEDTGQELRFYFFDPAFAGVHSPILDMTKPIFHNVFARWMYYPEQVVDQFEIAYKIIGDRIIIEHTYQPSDLRLKFLASRKRQLLVPIIDHLKREGMLPQNWQEQLRAALFCCPFLTVNLLAKPVANGTLAERYPLAIKLLGLSMAIEFGASTHKGNNAINAIIDDLFSVN